MTERPKVRHWKCRVRVTPYRGFESLPLRSNHAKCWAFGLICPDLIRRKTTLLPTTDGRVKRGIMADQGVMEATQRDLFSLLRRPSTWLRLTSVLVIGLSLFLLNSSLPTASIWDAIEIGIDHSGNWGPILFGILYVLAVVFMLPGSGLTIASGVLFGTLLGTIIASIASTIGAAITFLIARTLGRQRLARFIQTDPRLFAIDQAIRDRGVRIVALLRLSPVVPFNLQNYLYGFTAIPFVQCILTSWITMIPGTLLFVWLGELGRASIQATTSTPNGKTPLEWGLLIIGLLATFAVTFFLSRIAKKAISEIHIQEIADKPSSTITALTEVDPQPANPRDRLTIFLLGVATLLLIISLTAQSRRDQIKRFVEQLISPPRVVLNEAYDDSNLDGEFDHSDWDHLLNAHLLPGGWVDYEGIRADRATLSRYLETLGGVDFDQLSRNEKLALLLNAYNAFTVELILEHPAVNSILEIRGEKRWKDVRWNLGGEFLSLEQLEHERIRPRFREPRVHFALVCASVGCPPLRAEAYTGDRIEEQLEEQAQLVHSNTRWLRISDDGSNLWLTRLYQWYGNDFAQVAGSELNYIARYHRGVSQDLNKGRIPRIQWLEYDWSLNDVRNRP